MRNLTDNARFEVGVLKGMMEAHNLVVLKSELEIAQRLQQVLDSKIYKQVPGWSGTRNLAEYLGTSRAMLYRNIDKIESLKIEISEQEKAMKMK